MVEQSVEFPAVELASFLCDRVTGLVMTKHGRLTTDGRGYLNPDTGSIYKALHKMLSKSDRVHLLNTYGGMCEEFGDLRYSSTLAQAIKDCLTDTSRDLKAAPKPKSAHPEPPPQERPAVDFDTAFFNDTITTPLSKLKLILNLENHKTSILYDTVKDQIHKIDYDIITRRLKSILGDGVNDWLAANTEDCHFSYRPGSMKRLSVDHGKSLKIFNVWHDADWRKDWHPDPDAKCPQELADFMFQVFPEQKSRYFVEAWIRDAAFERAEPIMILTGPPGTGKTLTARDITSALVGKNNYRSASRGFNKSYFHSGVTRCRVFFLDEMNLTLDSRETLKDYHNGVATIERKGVDVGDPEKIYASFVLANNIKSKVNLEYTDRKFFVPTITDVPLLEAWDKDRVDGLIKLLYEDQDFIRQYASYLYFKFNPQEARNFPKTALFKELCVKSLHPFMQAFAHACSQLHQIHGRSFSKGKRLTLDAFQLKDHLELYESQFGESLASLDIRPDGSWLATSKLITEGEAKAIADINQKPIAGGKAQSNGAYKNGNGAHKAPSIYDEPETPDTVSL